MYYDIFNGDADGICALHQLRLHTPCEAALITGVKRDIGLLARVEAASGDALTVLDIALEKNRDSLIRLLKAGATIDYFDHHFSGDIPSSPRLDATIDTDANTCTSLLVNRHLHGTQAAWAVVGAFGDNLFAAAGAAAHPLALSPTQLQKLAELGTLLNYNAYGITTADLHFDPSDLYRAIAPFCDPFAFMREAEAFPILQQGFRDDMAQIEAITATFADDHALLLTLPDAPWSRRVSGVYANKLARQSPDRAHALVTELPDHHYRISVRAPLNNREGADQLCMQFPTGGGRKAAAGINALPTNDLTAFIVKFRRHWLPTNAG
ncbi:MAG: DHH family phosphoesterase [Mariprofundales bacterium]|nr:DHH family phosphoesterase [Mariprofundales bacterium]